MLCHSNATVFCPRIPVRRRSVNLASPELAVTLVVPDNPVLASAFDATTVLEESEPVVTTFWSSSLRTTRTSALKSKAFLALDGPETTTSKAAP